MSSPETRSETCLLCLRNICWSDAKTGEMLALVDGGELTARRTAAASALAARYLARADAHHMLMIGTGRLATNLISAHMAVRSIETVTIWGRSEEKASALAEEISTEYPVDVAVTQDLDKALMEADIISAGDPLHGTAGQGRVPQAGRPC